MHPSEVRSENGVLRTTITAAPGQVELGNHSFPGMLYNKAYLPPLLRPRLGDTLRITFRNDLPGNPTDIPICGSKLSDNPSNLHFHGMAVSPHGNSVPNGDPNAAAAHGSAATSSGPNT
jgi:FtsP/CotA-like multicopper oxidase with cupredoxin domain